MTASKRNVLKIIVLLVVGAAFNLILLAFAGAILESKFDLRQHFLDAQRYPAASEALAEAFHAKDFWSDLGAIPIIGCLIGVYAGLVQRRKPALFAIGCLLPMLAYEVMTQPVRTWPTLLSARYFGMRVVGFLLAILVAVSLRGFLNKGASSGRVGATAQSP